MANYRPRCQTQWNDRQITTEILQTYDLLKFAIAQSNCSNSPYNTTRTNFGPQVDKAVYILKLFSFYYYFLLACSIKPHDFRFSDVNL